MKPVVRLPVHVPDFDHVAARRTPRIHHAVMAHIPPRFTRLFMILA